MGVGLLRRSERPIAYGDFLSVAAQLRCSALSVGERPGAGEVCRQYETNIAEFFSTETYPVRFVNKTTQELVSYDHENATPIRFRDFLANPEYVKSVLTGWHGCTNEWDRRLPYMALHCGGCNRTVVIDGTHRLTWLGSSGGSDKQLFVVELSGYSWRRDAPDIGVICGCPRPAP